MAIRTDVIKSLSLYYLLQSQVTAIRTDVMKSLSLYYLLQSQVTAIRTDIIKSLSLYYYTFVDIMVFKVFKTLFSYGIFFIKSCGYSIFMLVITIRIINLLYM